MKFTGGKSTKKICFFNSILILSFILSIPCQAINFYTFKKIYTITPTQNIRPVSIPFSAERTDHRPAKKIPVEVKGLYMTGWVAGIPTLRNRLIQKIDQTELNAVVLDVKDDEGQLTDGDMGVTLAVQIGAAYHKAKLSDVLTQFEAHQIYPIARIVCFKDPILAKHRPDLAIKMANGQLWRDRRGLSWVDPSNKEVWKYIVDVAKASALLGFREIQFDYVRFLTDGNIKLAVYPNQKLSKEDSIAAFLTYAKSELVSYNVFLSADVFGLSATASDDIQIGQKFEKIANIVDYICPMVYPSHYAKGTFGLTNPNAYPYETVYQAMLDGMQKNPKAIIRPWLQDFSLGYPPYTGDHVQAQKNAVYKAGLKEWILWNPSNIYH